jgi:hypothetical protein
VTLAVLTLLLCLSLFYWHSVRGWYLRWGSTDEDLSRAMLGDADIPEPTYSTTLAVTVQAEPQHIWPWLVQMGNSRGGLYSYDWLDRFFGYLDRPSANVVLPEFRNLKVGDEIPLGLGPAFPVRAIEPNRALVLGGTEDGFAWTWQFGLYPLDQARTRLVSRNTARESRTIGSWLLMRLLEPAAFIMTRRMLLGIKQRAEGLSVSQQTQSTYAA